MTQRAGKPTVASLTNPISLAMFMRRVEVEPLPPAPALFTWGEGGRGGVNGMHDEQKQKTLNPKP